MRRKRRSSRLPALLPLGPCVPALLAAMMLVGCRSAREVRDPEYASLVRASAQSVAAAEPARDAVADVAQHLAGPQPVEVYVEAALGQNPEIQAARKRVDALAEKVPQEASLNDPMLSVMGFPFYPAVPQQVGGRETVRLGVSQEVPWFGKLRTRASMAEAEANMARAELAAAELQVIEQVKRAYYELYFVQQATRITEEDRKLLVDLTEIAEGRYKAGKVSQQDVLRAQVELANIQSELIRLRQQRESSQAKLAQLVHVSPETPVQAMDRLPQDQVPRDLDRLYRQAVGARPELHAQLAAIERDRYGVELARLAYRPDFNFSVDWTEMTTKGAMSPDADGIDDVGVGVMVNLPIYRNRLDAGVRSAEAQTVSSARKYDSLRDQTLQEVKDLFAQANSQLELFLLFRDNIVPKAEQTLEVSRAAYQVGDIDFLQLIDNWRQLLQFRIMLRRQESQLEQTLASLERVVGGELPMLGPSEAAPAPAESPPPAPEPPSDRRGD